MNERSRFFNKIQFLDTSIIKSSSNIVKIDKEIKFYQLVPDSLSHYFPKFLGSSNLGFFPRGYELERISEKDLGIYFCMNDFDHKYELLLEQLETYFNKVSKKKVIQEDFYQSIKSHIYDKIDLRLNLLKESKSYETINNIFIDTTNLSLKTFAKNLKDCIQLKASGLSNYSIWFSHGDLCLSNLFIVNDELKMIDPMGIDKSSSSSELIPYYDFAKLSQCLLGYYDLYNHNKAPDSLIPNRYESDFRKLVTKFDLDYQFIRFVESSHFLSMIPLHNDCEARMRSFAKQSIQSFNQARNL